MTQKELIVIIDFGSQVHHLISKKIRKLGVFTEIIPSTAPLDHIQALNPSGIILSGGPRSIYEPEAPQFNHEILELDIPVLGICYGFQLLADYIGATVRRGMSGEYGIHDLLVSREGELFKGVNKKSKIILSHRDGITSIPSVDVLAQSDDFILAFEEPKARMFGLQFHPEVEHTEEGEKILKNFLRICGCSFQWSPKSIVSSIIHELKETIKEPVLMAVSGGVDSTVAASLLQKAIPNLLYCVFIDNGLLRKGEREEVIKVYEELFSNFCWINAEEDFITRLQGITEPEEKRKIIGHTFVELFEKKSNELKLDVPFKFLGQGTIYPDRVESAATSKDASIIKTHHNVGGLPDKMKLKLIEPLKDFYKFEVRKIGREANVPEHFLTRHPFPGPGLAVRCIGEVQPEKLKILRESDAILKRELEKRGLYEGFWQAFTVLPDIKTTGVMGDVRTYAHCVAIRIVNSSDAMTASVPTLEMTILTDIATKMINEVLGINRVVFDLTSKPPGTIEWE